MKFVTPNAVIIDEKDPLKKIELAGRTCYKSENKITDTSAEKFVGALIRRQHTAMLEHACFVFQLKLKVPNTPTVNHAAYEMLAKYHDYLERDSYLHTTSRMVSGNIRAICQRNVNDPIFRALKAAYPMLAYSDVNGKDELFPMVEATIVDLDKLPNLTLDEIGAHKYVTFRFITDRGVTHELVRHRPCSFAQESTRYVNYHEGLSIALPTGFYERPEEVQEEYQSAFLDAERHYGRLIEMGQTPQQARAVLPNATKTEIVVTTSMGEWHHILNLRLFGTTGAPHPDIKTIMEEAYPIFMNDPICKKYLEETKNG